MKYILAFLCLLSSLSCQKEIVDDGSTFKTLKNVVLIIGDDHMADVVGIYGNKIIQTPNLDRIAREGVFFSRAFANAPLCSASRQSILTGKYPHAAGVTMLRTAFDSAQYTIADHLRGKGFKTGIVGKTHFNNYGPNPPDHGFSFHYSRKAYREYLEKATLKKVADTIAVRPAWKPFRDPARIWLNADQFPVGRYDEDMEASLLVEAAKKFISGYKFDRFFLTVGFHEPHSPFDFPIDVKQTYDPADMPLPPTSAEDDQWIPAIFKDLSEEDKRGIIASYYTSVSYLDEKVGEIYDHLVANKLADKTLFIYIGDQGYLLGHHKRFEKHMMWDEANHAPLIVKAGNNWNTGRKIDALTEFVDLAPSILDLLGVEPMLSSQGNSFLPVLSGRLASQNVEIFSEFLVDNKVMVRTEEWKYIYTTGTYDLGQGYATGLGPSGVSHRLYNLSKDPYEHQDVAELHPEIMAQLQDRLLTWFMETHPFASDLPTGLSLEEKLAWFSIPPEGEEEERNKG